MRIEFHPDARAELRHLAEWYEERRAGLGGDLRDEISRALATVVEQPSRWPLSPLPKAHALGVRQFVVSRFPLSIQYNVENDLYVFAVAHMRRRPGYWLGRLEKRKPGRR